MALTAYQTALTNLLQTPQNPVALITAASQTVYINQARQHVAAEGECVRVYGALPLVIGQRNYAFSTITFGGALGIKGVNSVRTIWYTVPGTSGQLWLTPRDFAWFSLYNLNNAIPASGPPSEWAQLGQGQAGTIFIDPLPDIAYSCPVDIVAAPVDLVSDTTAEAIPALWQDAVPFYAAWLAYMNLLRNADADRMLQQYEMMMQRARHGATSPILPHQQSQGPDDVASGRLGGAAVPVAQARGTA